MNMIPNDDKKIDLKPLHENELGQIEGGFAELPGGESETGPINMLCGGNICKATSTTGPQ